MGHRYTLSPAIPGTFTLRGIPARMLIGGGQWKPTTGKILRKPNGAPRDPQWGKEFYPGEFHPGEPDPNISDASSTWTIIRHLIKSCQATRVQIENALSDRHNLGGAWYRFASAASRRDDLLDRIMEDTYTHAMTEPPTLATHAMTQIPTHAIALPVGKGKMIMIIPEIVVTYLAWLEAQPRTWTEAVTKGPLRSWQGMARAYLTYFEEVGLIHWADERVNRHGWRWARIAKMGPKPEGISLEELLGDSEDGNPVGGSFAAPTPTKSDPLDLSLALDLSWTFEDITTPTPNLVDPLRIWAHFHALRYPQALGEPGTGWRVVSADRAPDFPVIQWNEIGLTRLIGVKAPSRAHLDRSPSPPDWITERRGWFYAGWLLRAPVEYATDAKPLQRALRAAVGGAQFAALAGPNPVYRWPDRVPQSTEWLITDDPRTYEEIRSEMTERNPR